MAKSKFVSGYLKWDGRKYVVESTLISDDDEKIVVNVDDDNSKVLYFQFGKCKIIQK